MHISAGNEPSEVIDVVIGANFRNYFLLNPNAPRLQNQRQELGKKT